jgi:predicted AAA+ superfamily ATPase
MSLPTIFDTCRPRADVLAGTIRDDEFMADLSRVVNGTAPADYLDPAAFFAKSYPTRGMKELLKAVCLRLSGKGGEVSSIIRLGTEYVLLDDRREQKSWVLRV